MARVRYKGAELRRRQEAGAKAIEAAINRMGISLQASPFARGALQGASLSGADELYGLFGGDRGEMAAANQAAEEESPLGYGAGKFAGEAASLLIPGGVLFQGMRKMPMLAKMAGGSVAGSAIEGLRGYLEGEGPSERAQLAQDYATIGGVVGGAIPALGPAYRGAKRGVAWARRNRNRAPAADTPNMGRRNFLRNSVLGGAMVATAPAVLKATAKTGAKTAARAAAIKFGELAATNPRLGRVLEFDLYSRVPVRKGLDTDTSEGFGEFIDDARESVKDVELDAGYLTRQADNFTGKAETHSGRLANEEHSVVARHDRDMLEADADHANTLLDAAEKLEGADLDAIGAIRTRLHNIGVGGANAGAAAGAIAGGAAGAGAGSVLLSRFAKDTAGSADISNPSRREFMKRAGAVGATAAAGAMVPSGVKMATKALGKTGAKTAARAATIKFGALHKLNPDLAESMGENVIEYLDDDVLERLARERGVGPDDDDYYNIMDEMADDVDLTPDDLLAHAESYVDDIESVRGSYGVDNPAAKASEEAWQGYVKSLLDEAEKLEGANLDEIQMLRARINR